MVPISNSILIIVFILSYVILNKNIADSSLLNRTWTTGINRSIATKTINNESEYDNLLIHKIMRKKILANLPSNFDSRKHWPHCPTIAEIGDQGSCGACWAVATASAISDRICIHSSHKNNVHVSAHHLLTCCTSCGNGCYGGDPITAYIHWVENGIVSGGAYLSEEGCQPYQFQPCSHDLSHFPPCNQPKFTPKCEKTCTNIYHRKSYVNDLNFGNGRTWYLVDSDQKAIMTEILLNGPVTASMYMYEDIFEYHSGVYVHQSGRNMGYHAVRIIGWGVEDEIPYWLVANSFNSRWGDNGHFKMRRGSDECGIEDAVITGIPLL